MKGVALPGFLIFLFGLASWATAQEIHYLGRFPERGTGLIRILGQHYEVAEGTVIANWGTVAAVTQNDLILQVVLSEAEKQELARKGAAVYDILQIHIPREDLKLVPFRR